MKASLTGHLLIYLDERSEIKPFFPQTTLDRSDQRSPTQRSMVVIARSGAYSRLESKERSGLSIHSDLKFEFDSEINWYSAWTVDEVCT